VGKSATNRVVIPASALVEENGRMVVYVKNGNDFQAIPVQAGQKASDQVEILDGVYEGDEVVTQGAKQLRAQSLISASKEGAKEKGQEKKSDDLPTLLMGIAIGVALMLSLGAVWLYLQKQAVRGRPC
jgi:membrane fusion protein, heavy metal efflux system